MFKKAVRLLRGQVSVRVEAPYPERVLNLCATERIDVWDVRREGDSLLFSLRRADYAALRAAVGRLDGEMSVEDRRGAPYLARRLRRRRALAAGLAVFALLGVLGSLFVWDFSLTGNETVGRERILRALEDAGLRRGSFAYTVRPQDLCNRVLPELPELAWLSVNIRGCRAYVTVRERVARPELEDDRTPRNVVAKKNALVTRVEALTGERKVLPGSMVLAGQLLISGTVETGGPQDPSVAARFVPGRGSVYGRTWYDLSTYVPLRYEEKVPAGEEQTEISLRLGTLRVKFPRKGSSNRGDICDKITEVKALGLPGGVALPVSVVLERTRPCSTVSRTRTRAEAEAIGEERLLAYLKTRIDGEITAVRVRSAVEGERLLVTISAECLEQIGRSVVMPVE